MALKNKISTALLTDAGRVRNNNEDAIAESSDLGLLVLADGMGGYNAGEIASGIATSTVLATAQREWKDLEHGVIDAETGYSVEALMLKRAVETAHAAIFAASQSQPQCAGMGTTVVACLLHQDLLSIAYVGDSRLYRFREGQLTQITRDHSLLEELIARGHYTREEAMNLVRKNIVTRALGVEDVITVDLIEDTLEVGDILLLCSDGLNDMVSDAVIASTIGKHTANVERAAKELVRLALENGGKDNVSVALARVDASLMRSRRWYERIMEWV